MESVTAATWAALVPQLADVLEALRATGPGGPGPRRLRGEPQLLHDHPHELIKVGRSSASARSASHGLSDQPVRAFIEPGAWHRHLLGVGNYPWHAGWGARADADAVEMFEMVRRRLGDLAVDDAPMSLLHADWINRNVHVLDGRISGVFDWGCSRFGDHLYDLAWFEFLAPWHPNLDVPLLRQELESRWDAAGIAPLRHPDRRLACLLHIGLDHIVYHVLHGTTDDLHATMDRLADYL